MSAINRNEAIEVIEDELDKIDHVPQWVFDRLTKRLRELPTVEPHWIPCSERLPEEKDAGILKKIGTSKRSDYVIATVDVKGEQMTVTACTYDGVWDWNMKYAFPDYKIVAWMPLPEPYRGANEAIHILSRQWT